MATASNPVSDPALPDRRTGFAWKWLAALGLLVAAVLAFALVALRQSATSYPKGSPQHAVSTYLGYLQRGNVDRAYAMTDFSLSGDAGDPRSNFHQQWDGWNERSHRITVVRVSRYSDGASVTADVESFAGGPLGASDSTVRITFTLLREHGAWHVTGPEYAYLP